MARGAVGVDGGDEGPMARGGVLPRGAGLAAVGLLSVLWACGGTSPTSSSSTADCSVAGENEQILTTMQSWYYWYQSLPAGVNPAGYSSPAALLDAVREKPDDRFSFITTQAADQSFYGAGQYVGYGFGFQLTAQNEMQVLRVFAGGPAAQAGLDRGDLITAVNGTPVPTLVSRWATSSSTASSPPRRPSTSHR